MAGLSISTAIRGSPRLESLIQRGEHNKPILARHALQVLGGCPGETPGCVETPMEAWIISPHPKRRFFTTSGSHAADLGMIASIWPLSDLVFERSRIESQLGHKVPASSSRTVWKIASTSSDLVDDNRENKFHSTLAFICSPFWGKCRDGRAIQAATARYETDENGEPGRPVVVWVPIDRSGR